MITELKHAWRGLLKSPGYSSACILILAAGIGLSLYMFGAINGFILKPLPFTDGDRLVHLEAAHSRDPGNTGEPSLHDYVDLRRDQRVLSGLHAYDEGTINLSDGVRPERYDGAFVSGEAFSALGLEPLLGRNFNAADEAPGAAPVVLIGYQLWQNRFAGAADIVGQPIRLNGQAATIIGVMPQGFRFPRMHQVWTLLDTNVAAQPRNQSRGVEIFGHLAPGQTLASAQQSFATLMAELAQRHPDTVRGDLAVVKPYAEEFINPITRKILFTMLIAVVLVLLIACANVANLMVVRGSFRARELALRSAIGAGRGRLAFGVFAEAALIAVIAAAIGWLGAQWGGALTIDAIRNGEDPPVYWVDFAVDGWAYLFTLAVVALSILAAGFYPALRAAGQANAPQLRDGGHGATDRRSGRLTRTLVLAEIAFCTALLCAAGLTVRSVWEIQAVPTGAQMDGVLTGRLGMFPSAYPEAADRAAFAQQLQRELSAAPGVERAALASAVPMQGVGGSELLLEGENLPPPGERGLYANHSVITPGYFEVFSVPLLAGRDFNDRDLADSPPVAIVSSSLAQRLWPRREALGQRLQADPRNPDSPWLTVVGVVGDVMMDMEEFGVTRPNLAEHIYQPHAQQPWSFMSPVLRVSGEPQAFVETLRSATARLDPDMPVYWLRSMEDWMDVVLFDFRLLANLFGTFAAFALVLACAGLYAVLAYSVSTRTREIGVRRALGASRHSIVRLIAGQGALQVAIGLGLGALLGLGFGKALSFILYKVSSFDPLTFTAVAALLGASAALATWLPARRAMAVEPMRALRDS